MAVWSDLVQRARVWNDENGREAASFAAARTMERMAHARANPTTLRASGIRIKPMAAEQMRAVASHRQAWQSLAWAYRDMVPELQNIQRFRANVISKVRFYVAEIPPDDDEPIPLAMRNDEKPEKAARVTVSPALCEAAEQELARLPLDAGYSFLGVWSENFDAAGEAWLHGRVVDDVERWEFRSVLDVDVQGSNLTLKDALGRPRKVDLGTEETPGTEELYRLWVPHPAHPHLADSPLHSMTDVLEDIVLKGRELRAVARSRIMTNGALFMPETLAAVNHVRRDEQDERSHLEAFGEQFEAAMVAPIANEGDAGGVVPLIVYGSREDIEAVRHIKLERTPTEDIMAQLTASIGRMGSGLDIPPELVTGIANANHWTAWQIDASTFRHHLEPGIRIMADSLTMAYLRDVLADRFPAEQLAKIRVWYDAGKVTENPNRRQDALDALDRILIGPAAGREALGFGDADAPTPEEALQLIAAKNGIDQSTAAAILAWAAEQEGVTDLPAAVQETVQQIAQAPAPRQLPPGQTAPDPQGVGGTGAPDTAPTGVTAAVRPLPNRMGVDPAQLGQAVAAYQHGSEYQAAGEREPANPYRLALDDSRALAEIDERLRDQLLAAAEQAVGEALRRAGSRLRSKATRDQKLHASLQTVPVQDWAARIGRDQCLALNADIKFLMAGAWEKLSDTFAKRVRAAIGRLVARVQAMLGLDPKTTAGMAAAARITSQMESRLDGAWAHLQEDLDQHLEDLLFTQDRAAQDDQPGEQPEHAVPAVFIRDALAELGGPPPQSEGISRAHRTTNGIPVNALTNGSTVTGEFHDANAIAVGYEWRYGYEPRAPFPPHLDLDRKRFTTWTDDVLAAPEAAAWLNIPFLHPGDHGGCLCSFASVWAFPRVPASASDGIVAARLAMPPSESMAGILAMADGDDRAGRSGTTAQELRDQYLAVRDLRTEFLGER